MSKPNEWDVASSAFLKSITDEPVMPQAMTLLQMFSDIRDHLKLLDEALLDYDNEFDFATASANVSAIDAVLDEYHPLFVELARRKAKVDPKLSPYGSTVSLQQRLLDEAKKVFWDHPVATLKSADSVELLLTASQRVIE